MPGIGIVMRKTNAAVVPTFLSGAAEAMPRGRHLPSFKQITLVFGEPAFHAELEGEGQGKTADDRIANGLRSRVFAIGLPFDASMG